MSEDNFAPYYSKMAQVLSEMIPVEWTELFMVYYDEDGVTSMGMYFRAKEGKLYWCHDIPSNFNVDEDTYDKLAKEFSDICEVYKEIFLEETGSGWSCMSLHLTSDMQFDIKYYYDLDNDADTADIMNRIFYETYQIEPIGDFSKKCLYEYLACKKNE